MLNKSASSLIKFAFLFVFTFIFNLKEVQSQSCTLTQFATSYGFNGISSGGFFDKTADTGYLFGNVRNYQNSIIKTDQNGNLLWAKNYEYTTAVSYSDFIGGKVDKNGNYFISICGNAVALLNPSGNVMVIKELKIPYSNLSVLTLEVLDDNKKIILAKDNSTYGNNGYMLLCLSSDLTTILWSKHLSDWTLYLLKASIFNNKIYVVGRETDLGLILCFDAITGNLINKFTISIDNKNAVTNGIYKYNDGFIVSAKYFGGETNNHIVLRLNNNLDIIASYRLFTVFENAEISLIAEPDGSYYGVWGAGGFGLGRFALSAQDIILWSRQTITPGLTKPISFIKVNDGLLSYSNGNWYNVGTGTNGSAQVLAKSNFNGVFAGCSPFDFAFQKIDLPSVKQITALQSRDTSFVTLQNVTPIVNDITYTLFTNCTATSICDNLDIQGPLEVCNSGAVTFTAFRNPGCYAQVNWQITGGITSNSSSNDSTITVNFLQPGVYHVIASLGNACQLINDTVEVTVSSLSNTLNIGPPDSTLCTGNTIQLNAGTGFTSYLWQDGSTDSLFAVTQPGIYYVKVVSACGSILTDTINITTAPPVTISIGNNRTKCNNDTIHINAPAGFISYLWSPNYNISSVNSALVVVSPSFDTSYFVKVERSPGCFGYDTIDITVKHSALINLGSDTSLCTGQSLNLNAGTGFISYLWSNGAAGNQVNINTPGLYSVIATASSGCKSYDTMQLLKIYPQPLLQLDKTNTLCIGSTRKLDAGNYIKYLWQDGSAGKYFNVSSLGTYFVKVTDQNGCEGNDTTVVNKLVPLPGQFLARDTTICNYGGIVISADQNFSSYTWNTGSSNNAIQVYNDGIYWLQVVDKNSCIGIDSITIHTRECLKGLYVPNAFSPNGDNKNDLFKAKLFGDILSYNLEIFNRYGQLIFATKNISEGWNGKVGSVEQETGSFVWVCRYQLNGEQVKIEKGTFTLIR